eukprot:TRINITY_DN9111_c0_g1_i4.p1 TRINITY_DN9111_c0_g1~~TRINITY_DN9111_c0_g1_i4.p1  ORF type:complete len:346 (+),score=35.37 TRINITY_DN9111_c0_g1_i4:110-1147(+)
MATFDAERLAVPPCDGPSSERPCAVQRILQSKSQKRHARERRSAVRRALIATRDIKESILPSVVPTNFVPPCSYTTVDVLQRLSGLEVLLCDIHRAIVCSSTPFQAISQRDVGLCFPNGAAFDQRGFEAAVGSCHSDALNPLASEFVPAVHSTPDVSHLPRGNRRDSVADENCDQCARAPAREADSCHASLTNRWEPCDPWLFLDKAEFLPIRASCKRNKELVEISTPIGMLIGELAVENDTEVSGPLQPDDRAGGQDCACPPPVGGHPYDVELHWAGDGLSMDDVIDHLCENHGECDALDWLGEGANNIVPMRFMSYEVAASVRRAGMLLIRNERGRIFNVTVK